jgi:hypothetical protein
LSVLVVGDHTSCPASAALWRSYLSSSNVTRESGPRWEGPANTFDVIADCGGRALAQQREDMVLLFNHSLKPGGVYVFEEPAAEAFAPEALHRLDVLQRGSFRFPDVPRQVEPHKVNTKTVDITALANGRPLVVLTRKGALDDQDYMVNGDYGTQYGEARHALHSRLTQGQLRTPWGESAPGVPAGGVQQYFKTAMRIFGARLSGLRLTCRVRHRLLARAAGGELVPLAELGDERAAAAAAAAAEGAGDGGDGDGGGAGVYVEVTYRRDRHLDEDTGQLEPPEAELPPATVLVLPLREFREALVADLAFGVEVHPQRLRVTFVSASDGDVAVEVLPNTAPELSGLPDKPLHRKKRTPAGAGAAAGTGAAGADAGGWGTWREYFGEGALLQPLSVLAQSLREKFIMVSRDGDQSDLFTGRVTRGMAEGQYRVELLSPDCSDEVREALFLNSLECVETQTQTQTQTTQAQTQTQKPQAHPPSSASGSVEEPPQPHSPLYFLFAKDKFRGYLGVPVRSSSEGRGRGGREGACGRAHSCSGLCLLCRVGCSLSLRSERHSSK